jgi:endonuclease/exonuclease/phosphatase family metal-dependent hydrolase
VKISIRPLMSALCVVALFTTAASAQTTVTIATSGSQVTDATIGSGTAAKVINNSATLTSRTSTDVNATRRALLKFDTQNFVPANATIQSAKLTVFVKAAATTTRRIAAYDVKSSFEESQATWMLRKTGYPWVKAGGDLGTQQAIASASSVAGTAVTFDVTKLVQARVNAGSSRFTRVALVDIDAASSTAYRQFHSSESTSTTLRPKLVVVYGGSVAPPPPTTGTRLRVLHYNLHHGVGTDGRYNLDRIASVIAKARPDIVSLNEVEKYTGWGNEDQPNRYRALLEAKTGQKWYFVFAQEYGNWTSNGKGNMVLSRFPWTSVARYEMSYSRTVALGQLVVNGRNITFGSTHLDPESSTRRLSQVKQLVAWADNSAENRIIAGDMNAGSTYTEMMEMKKTYVDSWGTARAGGYAVTPPDYPTGATRNGRIDFIFASKGAANLRLTYSEVLETRDANGVMPSDHRPVLTIYEVR